MELEVAGGDRHRAAPTPMAHSTIGVPEGLHALFDAVTPLSSAYASDAAAPGSSSLVWARDPVQGYALARVPAHALTPDALEGKGGAVQCERLPPVFPSDGAGGTMAVADVGDCFPFVAENIASHIAAAGESKSGGGGGGGGGGGAGGAGAGASALGLIGHTDLVQMEDVNEATILCCLRSRFHRDAHMTNLGTILVTINPFKWVTGLYTKDVMDFYIKVRQGLHYYTHHKSC